MSQLYMQAAQVVELWLQNRGGLKTLAFSDKIGNKAAVFSLSCESLKYKPVLTSLFASSGVHAAAVKLNIRPTLLLVMAYELLFGHGKIEGGGAVKRFLKENESKLRSSLARLKVDKAVANDQDLLPPAARSTTGNNLPRYVRVNTLVSTVPDAIALLVSEGFTFLQHATVPSEKEFHIDHDMPQVLVFAPNTEFHEHALVANGTLILQDKASCMPPYALVSDLLHSSAEEDTANSEFRQSMLQFPSWRALDACAAPGNKTSYLAALLDLASKEQSSSKKPKVAVDAFEIDKRRCLLLQNQMQKVSASGIVTSHHQNFLNTNPLDPKYSDVRVILCDPSCSSSGLVNEQIDQILKSCNSTANDVKQQKENVLKLSQFQFAVVKHAMSFPSVQRVSYSTCSINQEENEDVVQRILAECPQFELIKALPTWSRRGLPLFPGAENCLRCNPLVDRTHGFFVAVFQRSKSIRTVALPEVASESTTAEEVPDQITQKRPLPDVPEASNSKKPRGKRVKLSHSFGKKK